MDIKPGAKFEPEDFNPIGEPDPAAVQQAGAMPAPPPGPEGPPEGAVGGYSSPLSPQLPDSPPATPGQEFNQFGSPAPAPPGQFGGEYVPPRPPPQPDYSAPGQGRLGTPGAVPATEQVRAWRSSQAPSESFAAGRAMFAGIAAVAGFTLNMFAGSLWLAILVVVLALYAVLQGHQGLREVRRGRTGKAQAVSGLVVGYVVLVLTGVGIILTVTALAAFFGFVNSAGDIGLPGGGDAPPSVHTTEVVSANQLAVGDCILDPVDTAEAKDTGGYGFQVVPCSARHAAEVMFVDLDPQYGHPEQDDAAEVQCLAGFADYMKVDYPNSAYFYAVYAPTLDQWNAGDASLVCVVDFGFYLTESQQGTGA